MKWTVIFQELEADEPTINRVRQQMVDHLETLGYHARTVTAQSFVYRGAVKPPEPFQAEKLAEYQGPRGNRPARRNRHSE